MSNVFYRKWFESPNMPVTELLSEFKRSKEEPSHYIAEDGLVNAVNTALLIDRPLLVTGEPGTGKTRLAASIAAQLGLGEPLEFVAKSVSQAQDLFYTFDALARLKAVGPIGDGEALGFVKYSALGLALLFANEPATVQHLLPPGLTHPGQQRSVVLIDEVDKAPRDFSNDILVELENMSFAIPELKAVVRAEESLRPIVVITSNSERSLPDAFLRRCVYYDIPFPKRDRLVEILRLRLGSDFDEGFAKDALDLLDELRADGLNLTKKPATAELIGWMIALSNGEKMRRGDSKGDARPAVKNPLSERKRALDTMGALIKTRDDLNRVHPVVERWIGNMNDRRR